MIRRLRVWHRVWFALLAILLPALLFLALRHRPQVPQVAGFPEPVIGTEPGADEGPQP